MIKLIKNGLLSVTLLATVAVNASKIVTTKTADAKVLNITLTEITKNEVLSIKDTNGVILYTVKLQETKSFNKKFDFNTLPNGVYFLESKQLKEITVTPLILNEDKASFLFNTTKTFTAPTLKVDESIVRVFLKNFDKHPVNISIYDSKGIEIVSESNKELVVYKDYDFSKLEKGNYTVSVSHGDYTFNEEITF